MSKSKDFLRTIVEEDLKSGKYKEVVTRFPPEPNGFPHIGHAKSIYINFGIASDYKGHCNLRMDDTNPTKEDTKYVEALKDAVEWLGFEWNNSVHFTSDYFPKLHAYAVELIKMGKAYVDSVDEEEMRSLRGTVKEAGKRSKFAQRSIEENLDLFERMKNGEFKDGEHVLRAKIDMSASNMQLRDPLLYRIRHAKHHRTGNEWCIYPMYDFAHCLSDYNEGITHSLCTLEFENNRAIYNWVLETLGLNAHRPYQYEFARLGINYTVMSKRKLLDLVEGGQVSGWDDPRLPTIAGYRRRGYTPESILKFCDSVGIAKANSMVDVAQLEFCIRDDLNTKVPRVMAVLDPLKITIENYEGSEELNASYYPEDVPKEGSRAIPFSKEIYIERDDFSENPPKGYFRLTPEQSVRLKHAYIITCKEVIKDAINWFSLDAISDSPVSFSIDLLKDINKKHLKEMDATELSRYVGFADANIGELAKVYLEEVSTTKELKAKIAPVFAHKDIPQEISEAAKIMTETIKGAPYFESYDEFKNFIMKESGLKEDSFVQTLRFLLTGAQDGPDIAEIYKYLKNYIGEIIK